MEVYDLDHNQVTTPSSSTYLDGTYIVRMLPGGTYKVPLRGGPVGHDNAWYAGKTSFETADTIPLPAYGEATGIDADLPIGGGISGTVTCAGLPAKDFFVFAQVPRRDYFS